LNLFFINQLITTHNCKKLNPIWQKKYFFLFAFGNLRKKYLFCAPILKRKEIRFEMSRICEITGKTAGVGNNVSHSNRRTKKRFNVNLFYKKFYLPEEERWVRLRVSTSGLRLINKIGVQAAIKSAQDKGILNIIV